MGTILLIIITIIIIPLMGGLRSSAPQPRPLRLTRRGDRR